MMQRRDFTLILALITLLTGPFANAADLFRWQDEDGNVHYTDRVPSEYLKQGYRVISEQGLTIHTIKPKSSMDSKPAPPEIPPEQLLKDQRLLTTYANEAEIITARDRRLADTQALTELSKETIVLLEMQFRELTKEASDYEKQGKAIPEALLNQTEATRKKIRQYQLRSAQSQQEIIRLKQEFDNDLERYRQLKNSIDKFEN